MKEVIPKECPRCHSTKIDIYKGQKGHPKSLWQCKEPKCDNIFFAL